MSQKLAFYYEAHLQQGWFACISKIFCSPSFSWWTKMGLKNTKNNKVQLFLIIYDLHMSSTMTRLLAKKQCITVLSVSYFSSHSAMTLGVTDHE